MKDEQIEKGLECCAGVGTSSCKDCPYYEYGVHCMTMLGTDAFAYINRLKAEKAVSDMALELAVETLHEEGFIKCTREYFEKQVRQQLEKEENK